MDTVKFEIALARNPPRNSSTGEGARVPCLSDDGQSGESLAKASSVELNVPGTRKDVTTHIELSSMEEKKEKRQSLGDRFHDWMEMDLEHGL